MTSLLVTLTIIQQSTSTDGVAASFFKKYLDRQVSAEEMATKRSKHDFHVYDSIEYDFRDGLLHISKRTGEIVVTSIHEGIHSNLPKISPSSYSNDDIAKAFKVLRPRFKGDVTFAKYAYPSFIALAVTRQIDGISLGYTGDSSFLNFEEKTGELKGFRFPPTEAGIHKISKWMSESTVTDKASRVAFDFFKGPTQLNFDYIKKTYVGNNWYSGTKNPNHRAFSDPNFQDFLFPVYVVRYLDADSIRKDGVAMQMVDVFMDAEENSVFGYTVWSAGGGPVAEAKSLDGERFSSMKIGSHPEQKVSMKLTTANVSGPPSGVEGILFGKLKSAKVKIDLTAKLVWRGTRAYSFRGDK